MPSIYSENSLYIEKALQHAFIAKLYQAIWQTESRGLLEVSTTEIDDRGCDVVLSLGDVTRHVQFKSNHQGGRRGMADVNVGLGKKPSGCVVWYEYDPATLDIQKHYFFGGLPGEPLPDLTEFKVAKNSRANADGVKTERHNVRSVPKSRFKAVESFEELVVLLFGELR